jgi:hypothetical protein
MFCIHSSEMQPSAGAVKYIDRILLYLENSVLRRIQRLPALQAQVPMFRRDQPAGWTYPERSEVPCLWSQPWQKALEPLTDRGEQCVRTGEESTKSTVHLVYLRPPPQASHLFEDESDQF